MILAVMVMACNKADDFKGIENVQLMEFNADGTSFFNEAALTEIFSTDVSDLSDDDIAGLLLMREEEKMARDAYLAYEDLWEMRVFTNISKSEASHMDAILRLLEHFEIADPALSEVGEFSNSDIQALYDELIAAGSESAIKALEAAAFVEEYDILDLEKLLEETSNVDLQLVYGNLLKGSRNHLRAFVNQINVLGADYAPILLDATYFEELLSSAMDNGYGNARKGYGNAGNGMKGTGTYGDCLNDGTGGVGMGPNGNSNGTAVCDSTGVMTGGAGSGGNGYGNTGGKGNGRGN